MEENVARDFSVYWGFGSPLPVVDDRLLLHEMAALKQRATPTRHAMPAKAPPTPHRQLPALLTADSSTERMCTPTPPSTRRPQTAPASARSFAVRGAPTPAGSGDGALKGVTPQQARREKWLREQRLQQRRAAVNLEQRWQEADSTVSERRRQSAEQAHARVLQWDGKRRDGRKRVEVSLTSRKDALTDALRDKEERLAAWRQRVEADELEKRQAHAAAQLEATERFAHGLQRRDGNLAAAEARVAARAKTMAALKQAELDVRAGRAAEKQMAALHARGRAEDALRARIRATEEKGRLKAQQVESFLRKQGEERAAARKQSSNSAPDSSEQVVSPRQPSRPTSARRRAVVHTGLSGLEHPKLKCAMCDLEFSQLTGLTYLKAVATQKAAFGDDALLRWVTKRGLQTMYESASLCVFCSQFFAQGSHD